MMIDDDDAGKNIYIKVSFFIYYLFYQLFGTTIKDRIIVAIGRSEKRDIIHTLTVTIGASSVPFCSAKLSMK